MERRERNHGDTQSTETTRSRPGVAPQRALLRGLGATVIFLSIASIVLAHGESGRTQAPPKNRTVVVPTGGPTDTPTGPRGGSTTTPRPKEGQHTWDDWWAYNREFLLAERLRGRPTTGLRPPGNDVLSRRRLREGELYDVVLAALGDKHHDVRAAAAIALGKLGLPRADRHLTRRTTFPPEGWFDVREAAIFGMGLLGLPENRRLLMSMSADKERSMKERALPLVGLAMDGTQASADELEGYLKYFRSGIRASADDPSLTVEQEHRRIAAHLLGFVEHPGYDDALASAAEGGRRWKGAEQGLAITALGRRRATDYKGSLFRWLYRRELDEQAKRSAAIALGTMLEPTDEDDIRRLARFVRDSKRDNIAQNFGVMALGNIGGERAVSSLEGFLRDNVFAAESDRAFVHLALGLCGRKSERAREVLLARYRRARTWHARSALAVACGLARVKDALPLTIELLDKAGAGKAGPTNFLAWGTLSLGLHGSGLDTARKIFRKYAIAEIRENAAIALCLIRRTAAVPELVDVLKRAGTMHAKAAIVTALGVLPEPSREAVDALRDVYRDDSMPDNVRAMAIIALGALGDPRPVPLSAQLTRHYNYFIRCVTLDEIASFL